MKWSGHTFKHNEATRNKYDTVPPRGRKKKELIDCSLPSLSRSSKTQLLQNMIHLNMIKQQQQFAHNFNTETK